MLADRITLNSLHVHISHTRFTAPCKKLTSLSLNTALTLLKTPILPMQTRKRLLDTFTEACVNIRNRGYDLDTLWVAHVRAYSNDKHHVDPRAVERKLSLLAHKESREISRWWLHHGDAYRSLVDKDGKFTTSNQSLVPPLAKYTRERLEENIKSLRGAGAISSPFLAMLKGQGRYGSTPFPTTSTLSLTLTTKKPATRKGGRYGPGLEWVREGVYAKLEERLRGNHCLT